MTVLKGLAGLQKFQQDKEEAAARREAQKAEGSKKWMKLKDGQWIHGRFAQEIDETSPNFLAANGTAKIVLEHSGPGPMGYQRRAECTVHEDGCYPCEKRDEANRNKTEAWRDWKKAAPRVYINFLVTDAGGKDNPHKAGDVVLIAQNVESNQAIIGDLLEYAADGSITDREFRITCKGVKTDTTYKLKADDRSDAGKALEGLELNDVETAYKHLPYEEQANYYETTPGWTGGNAVPTVEASGTDGEKKGAFTSW